MIKFFFLIGLILQAPFTSAAPSAVASYSYGEYIMNLAWERMQIEIGYMWHGLKELNLTQEEKELVFKAYQAWQNLREEKEPLQFRSEGDEELKVRPLERDRVATTTSKPLDPIYVNRDRIQDPSKFRYSNAVKTILHELGHKIKKPDQTAWDLIATKIELAVRSRETMEPFILPNGVVTQLYKCNAYYQSHLYQGYGGDELPIIGFVHNARIYPIQDQVFAEQRMARENPGDSRVLRHFLVLSFENGVNLAGQVYLNARTVLRVDSKEDNTRYLDRKLMNFQAAFSASSNDKGELQFVFNEEEYGAYKAYVMGDDFKVEVDLKEYWLRKGHLVIGGYVEPIRQVITNNSYYGQVLYGAKAVFELNGKRYVQPVHWPEEKEREEYEMVPVQYLVGGFSIFHHQYRETRWEPRLIHKPRRPGKDFVLTMPVYFKAGEFLRFRFLGMVLPYQQAQNSSSYNNLVYADGEYMNPVQEALETALHPGKASSMGDKLYLIATKVFQPSLDPRPSPRLSITPGEKYVFFEFPGHWDFNKLFIQLNGTKKTPGDTRTYNERPLRLTFEKGKDLRSYQTGNKTVLIVPLTIGNHLIEADMAALFAGFKDSYVDFQLMEMRGELSTGEMYQEKLEDGPTLRFTPYGHLGPDGFGRAFKAYWNTFDHSLTSDSEDEENSCEDVLD